jgi:hypothetical protein
MKVLINSFISEVGLYVQRNVKQNLFGDTVHS